MTADNVIALVVAVAIVAYLALALIYPEKF
jgi:K+-transporting ATPase KdpF subunit